MENEIRTMPFGKVFRVANFSVIKTSRTLSKKQIAQLRAESGLPKDLLRDVQRAGLPYIKVSAISGLWAVEFSAQSTMFAFLDSRDYDDFSEVNTLHSLFTMWLADTSIIGDLEYWKLKGEALNGFLERQKSEATDKEHEKALEEVSTMMEAKEKMEEAAKELADSVAAEKEEK